jgi:myo-inositol-1(or 4)-monophosphatase
MKKLDWTAILGRAGLAGKKAILRNYTETSRHQVLGRGKGGDMTLRIDKVSEQAIYNALKRDLGNSFTFLSEEVGEVSKASTKSPAPVVVCDPLDGSHNAQVGIPLFSLALSVIENKDDSSASRTFGNISNSLITSIKTDDEFVASKGKGAFHNGKRMKPASTISGPQKIHTLLVETSDVDYLRDRILSKLSKDQVNKTRLLGSAAISYCMLAGGSADGYIFAQPGGARTIDSPAGFLIAREAGCVFSNVSESTHTSNLEDVEVGFDSRVNIVGARNSGVLTYLQNQLGILP